MSKHRGLAPGDDSLFSVESTKKLSQATFDLSWLFSRGYAELASLKLVGDRFDLNARQRSAVSRCSCTDVAVARRKASQLTQEELSDKELHIDGFNIITTLEVALSGGVVLRARDGCIRDVAGIHGTYRKVEETTPAIHLIGEFLHQLKPSRCVWFLDSPVSNSGRLKSIIAEIAEQKNWSIDIQLVPDPDPVLIRSSGIVLSADSAILDQCAQWFNLNESLIPSKTPDAWLVDLSR
jgi:hypothetical protein